MNKIFVLGSLNMDLTIYLDHFANVGETVNGYSFHTCPGGKGLNQAIAASKLGGKVLMCGAVGNDLFGKEMISALKSKKVNTRHIKIVKGVSSGIAEISVCKGDNKIALDLGANMYITKEDVDSFLSRANKGDIFLTQLEINMDAIHYALKVATEKGMITIVDPAPMNKDIAKSFKNIQVLTPNSEEMQSLSELKSFKEEYKNHLVATLGKDGYCYTYGDIKIKNKPVKVDVIDTTGAGDSFAGALAFELACGNKMQKEVLDFASLAASLSTTKEGSSVSSPTGKDIDSFLYK